MAEHDAAFWERARAAISEGFCPDGHRLEPAPEHVPSDASGGLCPVHRRMHWTRHPDAVAKSRTAL